MTEHWGTSGSHHLLIAALGLLLVSACSTYSLEELRHTAPRGNAFQSELAKLYMNFADSEEKDYDWQDSWYFADKGLLAAYGREVSPEDLENWNLPGDALAHLEKSRADLLAALTPEVLETKPEIAARAQFNFDCWVEQQEENSQEDDIEACRDGFVRALEKLEMSETAHVASLRKGRAANRIEKDRLIEKDRAIRKKQKLRKKGLLPAPAADSGSNKVFAPATTSFIVLFEPNSAIFTAGADSVLSDVVKSLAMQKDGSYEVVIRDKTATGKNDELPVARVQAVKNRLVEAGIKESAIDINNGAEKRINRPINRRVEIFLNE